VLRRQGDGGELRRVEMGKQVGHLSLQARRVCRIIAAAPVAEVAFRRPVAGRGGAAAALAR